MRITGKWRTDYVLWVEIFVLFNLAFLALDIFMAHSENAFRRQAEYIPLYFSLVAPPLLLIAVLSRERWRGEWLWNALGSIVGWIAVAVGLAGVIYHLDSRFFDERTLKSLTYAAPFAAPLAYTGVGLLLIMNRMVAVQSPDWAYWVLLFALGGFAGNFLLSLTDHAINGFYRYAEWIPVISSAFAVGFLIVPFCMHVSVRYWVVCVVVLFLQALVGVAGFFLHSAANLMGPSSSWFQNFVDGAPPFAPLLFPNLAILASIGLQSLRNSVTKTSP